MRRPTAVAVVALLALALPFPVSAGDRPLELLVVDMSGEGVRPDCMRDLVRVLRARESDTNVHRLGGARVRTLAGHDADGSDFTRWALTDLEPVVAVLRTPVDAVALIDCRADEGRADALVSSPAGGALRLRLRRTVVDAAWLAQAILMHGWTGFSP